MSRKPVTLATTAAIIDADISEDEWLKRVVAVHRLRADLVAQIEHNRGVIDGIDRALKLIGEDADEPSSITRP